MAKKKVEKKEKPAKPKTTSKATVQKKVTVEKTPAFNLRDLSKAMAEQYSDFKVGEIRHFLADAFGQLASQLSGGRKVQIHGFGTFHLRERKARKGRNPQTGEEISIPATTTIKFKPSREMKLAIRAL